MKLIEWRDEFLIGRADVDHEHRELIELINELYKNYQDGASKTTMMDFLGEIYAKIAAHFALEEKIMRELNYDLYMDHKTDHEKLLDDICDFMDNVDNEEIFKEGEFGDLLERWFVEHFRTRDSKLHKFIG
jgi:hemerythrin-like metal-binding protein